MSATTRTALGGGWVEVGPGWASSAPNTLEKRPPALKASLTLNAGVAAPPISVTRMLPWTAEAESAAEALETFLTGMTDKTPGLTVLERTQLRFADGAPGVQAKICFEPMPGLRTIQIHATRKWRGELVHLVATLAERDRATHEAELERVLESYSSN